MRPRMKSLAVVMVAFLGCSATEDVREAVGGKGDDPNPAAAAEILTRALYIQPFSLPLQRHLAIARRLQKAARRWGHGYTVK
mgnify:CR=1 FL=1